jgi:hypothetical protein
MGESVRLWYFFISVGLFMVAGVSFFVSFATWDSGRRDASGSPQPKVVALAAGIGVACVGLSLYLLSL